MHLATSWQLVPMASYVLSKEGGHSGYVRLGFLTFWKWCCYLKTRGELRLDRLNFSLSHIKIVKNYAIFLLFHILYLPLCSQQLRFMIIFNPLSFLDVPTYLLIVLEYELKWTKACYKIKVARSPLKKAIVNNFGKFVIIL